MRRERETPVAVLEPGDAQHHLPVVDRVGEHGIAVGRGAVGLDEQHIDADRGGARGENGTQELGDQRTRPGPLAARVERRLVDRHDHGRGGVAAARHEPLVAVEQSVAQGGDRRGLQANQQSERREQSDADRARSGAESQSSISRPSCAAETRSGAPPRVSSSSRRASRSAPSIAASLLAGSW